MLEEAIAILLKTHFLVKAHCRFSGSDSDFIQIMSALCEELPTNALPRKFFANKQ